MTVREVEVHGARIRARVSGDPGAPTVVLLHGIARSLEDWAPQHERLDDDYRVVSVDLPGFGLSDPLPGPPSLDGLAAGVEDTLAVLGVERPVHLMGSSLGGAVAMRMVCREPEIARSLTLVASAGFGREVTMALRILAIPGLGRQLMRRFDRRASTRVERSLFVDRSLVTDERVEFGLRVAARPSYAAHFLATAKSLGGFRGVHPRWRTDLLARVAELDPPTLVVWGEKDLILPAAHLEAARAALPHAEFHLFPRTGHMPQIERADEFASLARDFLKKA
ncbi:alpha/beta fold hydrolase [Actinoplanes sp. NPDC051470]|uniref:alpha/beta fold hydrolase n=1 Tax=unclassified Actinoplanes TaxID=2626549 RepID=UPI003436408C